MDKVCDRWQHLIAELLVKHPPDPVKTLLDDTFDKMRCSLIKMFFSIASPTGSWPRVLRLILQSRSILDMLWGCIWLWSQCMPDSLQNWKVEDQEQWVFQIHLLMQRIEYLDLKLNVALFEMLLKLRWLKRRLQERNNDPEAGLKSLKQLEFVLAVIEFRSQKINTASYKFPACSWEAISGLMAEDTADKQASDARSRRGSRHSNEDQVEADEPGSPAEDEKGDDVIGPLAQFGGAAAMTALEGCLPEGSLKKKVCKDAEIAGLATRGAGLVILALSAAGGATLAAPGMVIASTTAAGWVVFGNVPQVSIVVTGAMSYGAIKAWNRTMGVEHGATEATHEFIEDRREKFVRVLGISQKALQGLYSAHFGYKISGLSGGWRLLGWNNLGLGSDLDILEAMVWPCPHLTRDEVVFEFTALPHIHWDKQLSVLQPEKGQTEDLTVTKDRRRVKSRSYLVSSDWPLQLQVRKASAMLLGYTKFTDVGDPWSMPNQPDIGGSLIRIIFCKVQPNDY
eukprot:gnl/MRDRNA2_/MRDRNA2_58267_c0_seq1.p1 gnl/MRDRNA2_/MRDRNA2_58267_c0~~gnl/MRDRNA2_/MRDRNA2_58267_c0_seq1.p1  ORF type:complete len:511 (+),score=83.86 gnl/MRDRNA2_/MRDRNA2_58267_c0_seq1:128-1660(+)